MRTNLSLGGGVFFGMMQPKDPNGVKVFNWKKAAKIIKKRKPVEAYAGLKEDWGCTSGKIIEAGKINKQESFCIYLASTWATPVLVIDVLGDGVEEEIDCWIRKKNTEYDSHTYWPKDAKDILKGD